MNKGMMGRTPSITGSPSPSRFHSLFSLLSNEVSAPRCLFFFPLPGMIAASFNGLLFSRVISSGSSSLM